MRVPETQMPNGVDEVFASMFPSWAKHHRTPEQQRADFAREVASEVMAEYRAEHPLLSEVDRADDASRDSSDIAGVEHARQSVDEALQNPPE